MFKLQGDQTPHSKKYMPWNWRAHSVGFCGERETSTNVILIFVNLPSHSHPGSGVDHRYKKQKLVHLNFRDRVQRKDIWKELIPCLGTLWWCCLDCCTLQPAPARWTWISMCIYCNSFVPVIPVIMGPISTNKGKEEARGVLGAQELTVVNIRGVEKCYVISREIHVL